MIKVLGKQFFHFSLQNVQKVIKPSSMKTINVCLMTTNNVNFFGYFSNIFSELQIPSVSGNISNVTDITDPVFAAINMFKDHPSINNIKAKKFKLVVSLTHTNETIKNYY